MSLVTLTLAIPVLGAALLRSPWRALAHDSAQHVFFGACVAQLGTGGSDLQCPGDDRC